MKTVYISKYPNPQTEFCENEENVYIMCEFENLMDNIRVAQRMMPDEIIIDYKSFIDIADANDCDYDDNTTWNDLVNEFKRLCREGERV